MSHDHLSEERLAEYVFELLDAEARARVAAHIDGCPICATELAELTEALAQAPEVPSVSPAVVEKTWSAIVMQIQRSERAGVSPALKPQARLAAGTSDHRSRVTRLGSWLIPGPGLPWTLAKAAALIGIGFGIAWLSVQRGWISGPGRPATVDQTRRAEPSRTAARGLLSVDDYGDRLETLLLGVVRANGGGTSITPTVRRASRELLSDSRWYRQVASRSGDRALSDLLDELEMVLLSLATVPEGQEPALVAGLRSVMEEEDLLFRLRSLRQATGRSPRPTGPAGVGS